MCSPALPGLFLPTGKRGIVIVEKISGDLEEKDTRLFNICNGFLEKPVYAVLPTFHIMPANREMGSGRRTGSWLRAGRAVVRYNLAHEAYNLLASRNTEINSQPCV